MSAHYYSPPHPPQLHPPDSRSAPPFFLIQMGFSTQESVHANNTTTVPLIHNQVVWMKFKKSEDKKEELSAH